MGNSTEPLYEQVKLDIRSKIINKIFLPNVRLPSETELIKYYNASRVTIRRAIQELVDEGFLVKRHGVGTFVTAVKEERKIINIVSFAKECREKGISISTKLISRRIIKAGKRDNRMLGIPIGDPVILIERLRFINNEPVIIDRTYFTMEYKWLLDVSEDYLFSLNELLSDSSNEKEAYVDYHIEISYATELEASMLQCKTNASVFFINLCTFNSNMKALNRSEQLLVGDKFSINMTVPF